jgi:ubiquinone/menaquinone biosynthesis C-methylase UbiE
MMWSRKSYKWFYDHIHSHYYNLLVKWCFLPFGGEEKFRKEMIAPIDFSPGDKILDMCCGIGGVTCTIAKKVGEDSEVIGMDLSSGQIEIITHALHEMPRGIRSKVLTEARRVLRENGEVIILDLDNPASVFVRLFVGFWFFYWLPFNFETPTRRDMFKHGLTTEVEEASFKHVTKLSKHHRVLSRTGH